MDDGAAKSGRASCVRVEMKNVASAAHGRLVFDESRPGGMLPALEPGVSLSEECHMQRQPKWPEL